MMSVADRRSLGLLRLCCCLLPLLLFNVDVSALSLPGTQSAHARFPPWAGCMNASFAFDFRTSQSIPEHGVLLWYADDGGLTDFFVVMLTARHAAVRLVLRLADEVKANKSRNQIVLICIAPICRRQIGGASWQDDDIYSIIRYTVLRFAATFFTHGSLHDLLWLRVSQSTAVRVQTVCSRLPLSA